MNRSYEYQGFTLEVSVEAEFIWQRNATPAQRAGYIATVKVYQANTAVALFSPLRFGDTAGRPFATEVDAMMGGYSAARKIIDDLFSQEHR
jgi:hypothetical protein